MTDSGVEMRTSPIERGSSAGGGDYASQVNVGLTERWGSVLGGAALALYGITRGTWAGLGLAVLGGTLVYRGTTGHCDMYAALGIDRSGAPGVRQGNLGVKIDKAVLIHAPAERLYRFWRNLENLPRIMSSVESVRTQNPTRSHWVVMGPAGKTLEWDAEIINEKGNELIGWRSVGHPDVDHAGSVRFEPGPDGRGTVVRVSLQYDPPAGIVGHAVTALFGGDAGGQIEEDLANFKRAVESGQIAAA
ncbi:MAG: SRPBCC family protein [Candidatus Rokuibacteriota bacterium]